MTRWGKILLILFLLPLSFPKVSYISLFLQFTSGDEVWRPGAMDQDASQVTENADMWGADDSNEQTTFGSPANDTDGKPFHFRIYLIFFGILILNEFSFADGWGSSQGGNTWAPTTEKTESASDVSQSIAAASVAPVTVKNEQPASTVETHAVDGEETAVWFMERVCVQLKSDERAAVIKEVNSDKTAIVELENKTTQTIRVDEVSRVEPTEKDMVLVIGGADVGVEGELVCIDGSDAILKDSNEDFKIVDFVHLAKIAGES
jgi:transcription elongation factor SPT5